MVAIMNKNINKLKTYRTLTIASFLIQMISNLVFDFRTFSRYTTKVTILPTNYFVWLLLSLISSVIVIIILVIMLQIIGDIYYKYTLTAKEKTKDTPTSAIVKYFIPIYVTLHYAINFNEMLTGSSSAKWLGSIKKFFWLTVIASLFSLLVTLANPFGWFGFVANAILYSITFYFQYHLLYHLLRRIIEKYDIELLDNQSIVDQL